MALLSPHNKVLEPRAVGDGAGAGQLGPNTRVVGSESVGVHGREVVADLVYGEGEAGGADGQVLRGVDPLDVGAEADAPGEVEGQVGAQPGVTGARGRVNEAREAGPRRAVGKVVALGEVEGHAAVGAATMLCTRAQPSPAALTTASAVTLEMSPFPPQQRRHEPVRIHDPRLRALQTPGRRAHAFPVPRHLGLAHPAHRHVQLAREPRHALERPQLRLVLRHDPLARLAVLDAVLCAKIVQEVPAPYAQRRLEAVAPVVEPRVDHLAVSRRRLGPVHGAALEEERGAEGRERAGAREADDAGANDLELFVSLKRVHPTLAIMMCGISSDG
ncbi:unnamed protein product [Parascedosporium putredinis]|uniref:Uncharacterized protein n=1 Tax=Parascedosporium putredinis TaxID=1442378 RepID=A0A9P1H7W8_9PEZI|nr:unnamed protein product [Parascedosporium putredinis]CAI7999065.1 unnamed protein product [Parascedosporium putredinis]